MNENDFDFFFPSLKMILIFFPSLKWTCTYLLAATSPSCPSPLALWPVRPTTEGRGEHSAAGDEARERWARVSWDTEKDEFWDAGSEKEQRKNWKQQQSCNFLCKTCLLDDSD